jgi:hypothetical protein
VQRASIGFARGTPKARGTKIPVPSDKIKYDAGNSIRQQIFFIGSQGRAFCCVI